MSMVVPDGIEFVAKTPRPTLKREGGSVMALWERAIDFAVQAKGVSAVASSEL